MKLKTIKANALYDMVHGIPAVLERDNDGSHRYRFNIEPDIRVPFRGKEEKQVGWKCYEIRTFAQPTKANIKKAIIRSVLDETAEFDLVNSYNKHVLGVAVDEMAVERYKEYLQFTEDLDALLTQTLSN